ncbi:hypothetical protein CathTA2_2863 [Caldalkalibacillus thermarum TA2.A1]|uniref:Uncharacterized protein n=2 Tax=Caldalkalibacillus TaxID=379065 RepID=F5LAC8_CALTT|nr:hypothetical protein [Caldalkalibacillus thermarum]EGL81677.1 hypothetical protein CathTA2_2863 [Caldalkalibacillus thermarum TA2.A1]QZT35455.1 hypothetical protein HUR95_13380 [Caldalkalibacillus thermarum TA2.A1]
MSAVVPIKGATQFTINLDPGVWIFDKRKIDLDTYIRTGEAKQVPEREISGSYAIPFEPFLNHAEPLPGANKVVCHLKNSQPVVLSLAEAKKCYLAFALNGKPLTEDGPLHLYFGPGRHQDEPLKNIVCFEVKE